MAEFAALPEDNSVRYELQEGSLVVSPRPSQAHVYVTKMLCRQIDDQLPPEWTGSFTVTEPFPLTIDLDSLLD